VAPSAPAAANVLNFKYPPRNLPAFDDRARRHLNVATSGIVEILHEFIDRFLSMDIPFSAIGQDIGLWSRFFDYALPGGAFSFYPDATLLAYQNYLLEQSDFVASYRHPGVFSFKLQFRRLAA